MRKSVLIIRSVSVQQLDLVIPVIQEKFPEFDLFVLTHPHAVSAVSKNIPDDKILIYPYFGNFSIFNRFKLKKNFSVVVIPSAGNSLCGVLNVLIFSLRLNSKERYLISNSLKLIKISRFKICKLSFFNFVYSLSSAIFSVIVFILFVPFFSLCLLYKRPNKKR